MGLDLALLYRSVIGRITLSRYYTTTTVALGLAVAYLGVVRLLRWRRYNALHKKYQRKFELGILTPEEAQIVLRAGLNYDMPMLLNYAHAFALFKTYAVPSISKLLAATKELKSADTVSKRYADTEILISTWASCPISGTFDLREDGTVDDVDRQKDPRAMIALARVNWLHARYNISNDDMLYTLSLFTFEPATWAEKYGWRSLSPLEQHAYYVFWKDVGKKMGIRDIPESAQAFKEWSIEYDTSHMVPAQSNHDVAHFTMEELLHLVPERFGLKEFSRRLSICLLEDKVRNAMLFSPQPKYLHSIVYSTLKVVNWAQYYLCLPRVKPKMLTPDDMPEFKGAEPRMHPTRWQPVPWYKPESRSIFGAIGDRFAVALGLYDHLPGPNYRSEGYRLEEMGPLKFEHVGQSEVISNAERLLGCPIGAPWTNQGKSI